MSYLKHNSNGRTRPKAEKSDEPVKVVVTRPDSLPAPSMQHDINYVEGMAGIEGSLDWIAKGLARLTNQDHTVNLTLGQGSNIFPVKVTLADNDYDDTMSRLVTAFERIADSLTRLAGLSRPRLEPWQDQEAYMPTYRETCAKGGAAGPSADVAERLKKCGTPEDQKS